MENMELWEKLKAPPSWAKKKITGGRLSGMTDIKPQWRYQVMTEVFGACGTGWAFNIEKLWTESGSDDQVFAFAQVCVTYKEGEKWSEPVQGVGGSMLVKKESKGPHQNDEAFKMAVTDAIGTALKMIGVGADIYAGHTSGKYPTEQKPSNAEPSLKSIFDKLPKMNEYEIAAINSVWLIVKDHKPDKVKEADFKYEVCIKLHAVMNHWPTTEAEQEEAIGIIDKQYGKA